MAWRARVDSDEEEEIEATCIDCGTEFWAKGTWQKRCWPCWREANPERSTSGRSSEAQRDAEAKARAAGYDAGYSRGLEDGKKLAQLERLTVTAKLIRDAVTLCHPDRHPPERASLANRVTANLLSLLDAEKRKR